MAKDWSHFSQWIFLIQLCTILTCSFILNFLEKDSIGQPLCAMTEHPILKTLDCSHHRGNINHYDWLEHVELNYFYSYMIYLILYRSIVRKDYWKNFDWWTHFRDQFQNALIDNTPDKRPFTDITSMSNWWTWSILLIRYVMHLYLCLIL